MSRMLLIIAMLTGPAVAQPVRVTTDTAEYCSALGDRLTALRAVPEPIAAKVAEGRRMCAEGRVHAGIVTLRHCAMMLRQADP